MSDRMTVEEWFARFNDVRLPRTNATPQETKHMLWDWQGDRVELLDESDRRLALLQDASHMMLNKGYCSHCFPVMDDIGIWHHAPNCELAEELGDE